MKTNDEAIEQEIQAKGKTAPRITPSDIEENIRSEHYFTAGEGVYGRELNEKGISDGEHTVRGPLSLLTFCVLILRNGFTVTGESACASPENFDAEIGRKVARQNALQKIWPLMGYTLKEQLFLADSLPPLTDADVEAINEAIKSGNDPMVIVPGKQCCGACKDACAE